MNSSILFSTSYNPIIPNSEIEFRGIPLHHYVRPIDYKVTRVGKLRLTVASVVETHRVAKKLSSSHVILCNAGYEVPIMGLLTRLIRPSYKFVVLDYLMPRSTKFDQCISNVLTNIDVAIVIRNGDKIPLSDRFRISKSKLGFLKFPISGHLPDIQNVVEPYIFSGGTAHRDWVTFCKALDGLDLPAKVVTNSSLLSLYGSLPSNIEEIGLLSPNAARQVMHLSSMVCLSFQDTLLPSGPLVLLDAMAAGKAIIATRCNGTRDYITSGYNGLLYPPQDYVTLRNEAKDLHENPHLRQMYGENARQTIIDEHMPKHFYDSLLTILNIH